jgi:sec-independent protein translocase protein TatC
MSVAQDSAAPGGDSSKNRRWPKSRRAANPEARMPLIEHIRELRSRVIRATIAALAGVIAGWFIEPAAWNVIRGPFCHIPVKYINSTNHSTHSTKESCHNLIVTSIFDPLFIHLKLAIAVGLIISSPLWLYQFWAFVAPGLHRRERRWTYCFAGSAVPLFALGGLLAYFAMSKGLRFLLRLLPVDVTAFITVDSYLSYALAMMLIFGLAFELPLVMALLNVAGVLTHKRFAKWRRGIIFGVVVFAAVATPSPDPISMLLLAVPCVLLVELAEAFAWANDRRRARRGMPYPGLTPEEIAEYGLDTDPLASVGSEEDERGT